MGCALLAASLAWSVRNPAPGELPHSAPGSTALPAGTAAGSSAAPAAPTGRTHPAGGQRHRLGARTAEQPSTWWALLARLAARRSAIFAAPLTAAGMSEVDFPGSPADVADAALLRLLRARGAHVVGLDLRLRRVTVRSSGIGPPGTGPPGPARTPEPSGLLAARARVPGAGGWVVLAVSDTLPPYEVVSASGAVLAREPGRGPRSWLITLRWDPGPGWLIDSVAATASPE